MMLWYYLKALERTGLFIGILRAAFLGPLCLLVTHLAAAHQTADEYVVSLVIFTVPISLALMGGYWMAYEGCAFLAYLVREQWGHVALDARRLRRIDREQAEQRAASGGALSLSDGEHDGALSFPDDGEGVR